MESAHWVEKIHGNGDSAEYFGEIHPEEKKIIIYPSKVLFTLCLFCQSEDKGLFPFLPILNVICDENVMRY